MTQPTPNEHFPLDNLTYDLIAIMHEKTKALEACAKYEIDAQGHPEISQLLQQIRQQDEHGIQQLVQHIRQRIECMPQTQSQVLGDGTDTARLAST